jgi:hypothetical protein
MDAYRAGDLEVRRYTNGNNFCLDGGSFPVEDVRTSIDLEGRLYDLGDVVKRVIWIRIIASV